IYSGLKYSEPPVNGECEVRPTIGPGQLHQLIEQAIPRLDVEMAHVEDNIFSYEKDESLSGIPLKPFSVNISVTTEVQRNCKVHIYNVDIKENAFHFLDFDGNGRQDIVACGPNSFQEKNDFAKAIIERDQSAFKKA